MQKTYSKFFFLLMLLSLTFSISAAPHIRSMIVFGDSLSDTGNTTHLLKSLRFEENPEYLVRPFKLFIIHRMEDFADDYYVPQYVLDAGIEIVEDFFDHELGPMLANLISQVRLVPVLPGEPYWQNRFSNGRVWEEYLAPMLNIDREDKSQFDVQAFGGSWAVTYDYQLTVWNLIRHPIETIKTLVVGKLIPPSLGLTVQAWLLMNDKVSSDDLVFLFTGGNDYLNVLRFEDNYNPNVMSSYIDNVLDGIEYSIRKLIMNGAEKLVIMNLPDISVTPRFVYTTDKPVLASAVMLHNQRLQQRINVLRIEFPQVTFVTIDIPKLMGSLMANPSAHGFKYIDKPCIDVKLPMYRLLKTPFQHNPSLDLAQVINYHSAKFGRGKKNYHRCDDEAHYMFWDEVHPSTRTHQWFAFKVCEKLNQEGFETNCQLPG